MIYSGLQILLSRHLENTIRMDNKNLVFNWAKKANCGKES